MKKKKIQEIITMAQSTADKFTCHLGAENAERVLKLAHEKVKAKNDLLRKKYKENGK